MRPLQHLGGMRQYLGTQQWKLMVCRADALPGQQSQWGGGGAGGDPMPGR